MTFQRIHDLIIKQPEPDKTKESEQTNTKQENRSKDPAEPPPQQPQS